MFALARLESSAMLLSMDGYAAVVGLVLTGRIPRPTTPGRPTGAASRPLTIVQWSSSHQAIRSPGCVEIPRSTWSCIKQPHLSGQARAFRFDAEDLDKSQPS